MEVDAKEIENLEKVLKIFSKAAAPIAFQQALNETAAKTRLAAQDNIRDEFQIRNKWSERSVTYKRATGLNIDKMQAEVGSTQEYMAEQETGFTRTATGKHGIQVPTPAAAGESGNRTRTRVILRRNRKNIIKLHKSRINYGSKMQQNAAEIHESVKAGIRFWYGTLTGNGGSASGMWQIRGSVRKNGKGWLRGLTMRRLYTAKDRSIVTPKTEWLQPAGEKTLKNFDEFYIKALRRQLERIKAK
jgi:hypothetical protein